MRWIALATVSGLLAAAPLLAQPRGDAARGRELYQEKCVLCHGGKGQGWDWAAKVEKPPVPVPDLAVAARERSDQFLFDVVKEGGEAVGKTRFMPPFGFQLTDAEVWDLVAYMRALSQGKP
ncbi:MAG: cytochrome c [Candidatus Methylomirabilales bacterium]